MPGAVHMSSSQLPYSVAAHELLRNSLLDAACSELRERRWSDITMAEVAAARRREPADPLQRVPLARRVRAGARSCAKPNGCMDGVEQALAEHRAEPRSALAATFDV